MIKGASGRKRRLRGSRGSVSVEFALVALFFLFPLIAGGIDMVLVFSARAKLNSALHAIYIFAWSDPGHAADPASLQGVIQAIDPGLPATPITLDSIPVTSIDPSVTSKATTPATLNVCIGPNGTIDTVAQFTPPAAGATTNTCTGGGPNDLAAVIGVYSLTSVVQLPVPIPFLANPITLTAQGAIQVQ